MPPKTTLDADKIKELTHLLLEAKARGIELPSFETVDEAPWPVDDKGYFRSLDGRQFNANSAQAGFIFDRSRFVAYVGSRGSGKSASGAQKAVRKVMMGESGSAINPSFESFRYSTWPELRNWIPWGKVVAAHRHMANPEWMPNKPFIVAFDNGARIFCKGLRDPNSARGPNLNWLWYDEGQLDDTGLGWRLGVASVRIGKDPQAWITATPRGKDHWMYKFFEKQEIPDESRKIFEAAGQDRELIKLYYGTIEMNKSNLDPGFYASLVASYPTGWLRAQEIDGKFVDEGGTLGNIHWFDEKIIPAAPVTIKKRVRYWDLAASEKKVAGKARGDDPDETVGTLMAWDGENFYIEDQVAFMGDWRKIKDTVIFTAQMDGLAVPIWVEQEPGSGGKNQVAELAETVELQPYQVKPHLSRGHGDKIMKANIWFAEAALGKVYICQGKWNEPFLEQLASFPNARHDDKVDSVSGARLCVAPVRQWRRQEFLQI